MEKLSCCPVCDSDTIDSFVTTSAMMHSSQEFFNFDQCAKCNLAFINPRVPVGNLKNYYTKYYLPYRGAKAWGKFENLVENSQKKLDLRRVKRVTETLTLKNKSLILDIGCGNPTFLKACSEKLKCKTMGIDFSDEGWKDNPDYFKNINLKVSEIKNLEMGLQPDVITMWHYLEHDYQPLENLQYLKKIAKANTKLVIEIPNFDSESRKKFGKDWAGWHTPRHISLFSPSNVELLLKKSGWKVTKILSYGTMDPYLLYWMSRMEQKGIQWDKNMAEEFWAFVARMILFAPKKWLQKRLSLGVMTVIAEPA
ncbi:MAG: class I SAM-dependent methyltransferase [Crocinitomicaceae bacterium]